MNMTKHAQARGKQRGIPPICVDLLLMYGQSEPAGDGASIRFFDKAARRRVASYTGGLIRDDFFNTYLIVSCDQKIVTVGHRLVRILRENKPKH